MQTELQIEGVTHIDRDLYRVNFEKIKLPEGDFDTDAELCFGNPRNILAGEQIARGFTKEEMDELREAIRTEGLRQPLEGRLIESSDLQLVDGERRYRCIDKLRSDNVLCWDRMKQDWVPAIELYAEVPMTVYPNMAVLDAFKYAYTGNDTSKPIGDAATIVLVRYLREKGVNDDTILNVTNMSITWLRDTDALIALDEKTFDSLCRDEINRTAALEFSKITDVEERLQKLEDATKHAAVRLDGIRQRAKVQLEKARDKLSLSKAAAVEAELTGGDVASAKKEMADRSAAVDKKAEELAAVPAKARVTSKDVRNAENGAKPLTWNKISKLYLAPIQKILDTAGDGLPDGIQLNDLKLTKAVLEGIERAEEDIRKILRKHARSVE